MMNLDFLKVILLGVYFLVLIDRVKKNIENDMYSTYLLKIHSKIIQMFYYNYFY